MAERWRAAGDKLRKRSPARYEQVLAMLVTCELEDTGEFDKEIDGIYLTH